MLSDWSNHSARETSGTIRLSAGVHRFKAEYYERNVFASDKLTWSSSTFSKQLVPSNVLTPNVEAGLSGNYFHYDEAVSTYTLVGSRTDASVDFNWEYGSPLQALPTDNFQVEWTGKFTPKATGVHTFTTRSDDGLRLWVNGKLLIDHWNDHTLATDFSTIQLTSGQKYDIHLEYYEHLGSSSVNLLVNVPGQPPAVIPAEQLSTN